MTELPLVIAAAERAGRLIRRSFHRERRWRRKGPGDFVTQVDLSSEKLLRRLLGQVLPEAGFWGEESGTTIGPPGGLTGVPVGGTLCWVVDPLDGTTNFLNGYPHSAVSVALTRGPELLLAVVHDPYRRETFHACRGGGAWLGQRRLRVRTDAALCDALVATGFAPNRPSQFRIFEKMVGMCRGVRCDACASLDLAYVAAGRLSAFWEIDLKPWDVAAGLLLVEEAGGRWSGLGGQAVDWCSPSGDYLASQGSLHADLIRELVFVEPGLDSLWE